MGNVSNSDSALNESIEDYSKRTETFHVLQSTSWCQHLLSFRQSIEGTVILPADTEYTLARNRPFNQDQRGYPLVIVRVKNTSDVVKCVDFIREVGDEVKFCVACGCHSSRSMQNNSFVVDLVNLSKIDVNPAKSIVVVGGGSMINMIDQALELHGLGTPLGTYPEVGIGGLALSGGYGWLARQYGLTVDNLIEVEIVLANGKVVVANDTNEYQDLMWGIRGGGGNFGIVTKFTLKTHPLPSKCFGGFVVHLAPTIQSAVHVLKNFDNLIQDLDLQVSGSITLVGGEMIMPTAWSYLGKAQNIEQIPAFKAASSLGGWIVARNTLKATTYHKGIQNMLSDVIRSGNIVQSVLPIGSIYEPLSEQFYHSLLEHTRLYLPNTLIKAQITLITMGGEITRADNGEKTCIPHSVRYARYFAIFDACWKPEFGEEGKQDAKQWARETFRILSKYKTTTLTYAPDEVHTFDDYATGQLFENMTGYAQELYHKLVRVKGKYDHENFFKQNLNINPGC